MGKRQTDALGGSGAKKPKKVGRLSPKPCRMPHCRSPVPLRHSQQGPQQVPLPQQLSDDDSDALELSVEDLDFVAQQGSTGVGFLERLPKKELDRAVSHAKAKAKEAPPKKKKQQQQQQERAKAKAADSDDSAGEPDSGGSSDEEGEAWERRPRVVAAEVRLMAATLRPSAGQQNMHACRSEAGLVGLLTN